MRPMIMMPPERTLWIGRSEQEERTMTDAEVSAARETAMLDQLDATLAAEIDPLFSALRKVRPLLIDELPPAVTFTGREISAVHAALRLAGLRALQVHETMG